MLKFINIRPVGAEFHADSWTDALRDFVSAPKKRPRLVTMMEPEISSKYVTFMKCFRRGIYIKSDCSWKLAIEGETTMLSRHVAYQIFCDAELRPRTDTFSTTFVPLYYNMFPSTQLTFKV